MKFKRLHTIMMIYKVWNRYVRVSFQSMCMQRSVLRKKMWNLSSFKSYTLWKKSRKRITKWIKSNWEHRHKNFNIQRSMKS